MLQSLDILTDKPHRAHTFSGLFLTESLEMIQKLYKKVPLLQHTLNKLFVTSIETDLAKFLINTITDNYTD